MNTQPIKKFEIILNLSTRLGKNTKLTFTGTKLDAERKAYQMGGMYAEAVYIRELA